MATNDNMLIVAECSENPLMLPPLLDPHNCADSACNHTPQASRTDAPPDRSPVQRQSFFVGGAYVGPAAARVMKGQMYVEEVSPARARPTHRWPLVLIHGGGQTGMNWTSTPDGRAGWAEWLAQRGWSVYVVDQPARGRSAWQPAHDDDGDAGLVAVPAGLVERRFTAPRAHASFAAARLHTQWPGAGTVGDPAFDQYYASMVPVADLAGSEVLMRDAGVALLERIGPAVLVSHSQGGQLTWLIGDARPDLVKGIMALEPSGPPFRDVFRHGAPRKDRLYGLTIEPLHYDPEVTQSSPLEFEQEPETGYWAPKGPSRRLVRLAEIPVVLVTAQASYHAAYDHLTARYLEEAGVGVRHVRLEDHGILGNGHMMMLEKNSDEVVALVEKLVLSIIKP